MEQRAQYELAPRAGAADQPACSSAAGWLEVFAAHGGRTQAHSALLRRLMRTCRGNRDAVLRGAERLTLQAELTAPADAAQSTSSTANAGLSRSRSTTLQCLTTRGQASVGVAISVPEGKKNAKSDRAATAKRHTQELTALHQLLSDSKCTITELKCEAEVALIRRHLTVQQYPALTTLTLVRVTTPLPHPSHLPHVTSLTVYSDYDEQADEQARLLWRSVGAYCPQLQSLAALTMPSDDIPDLPWYEIFNPETATDALVAFETNGMFDEGLLGALVAFAPRVRKVQVGCVTDLTGQYRERQWEVTELYVTKVSAMYLSEVFQHFLANLPRGKEGRMKIGVGSEILLICVDTWKGFHDRVLERMPTWHFTPHPESDQLPIINLQANTSIDPKDVPFALARALQQLHALQVDQLHIYMIRFQLNEELIRLLTGALPYVAHLEMGWWVDGGKVTDDVLGQLLSVGPGLKHVLAPGGFDLQSYEQGMLAWPWQSVTTEVMTTHTVLALPTPDPLGSKRTIRADVVVGISYEEAVSGVAALLAEKMRGMHIARRPGIPEGQVGVYLPCPTNLPPKHQPTVLRAQLAAIRGCTIDPWLVRPLQLYNYTMTPALVQELAGLPEWNTILHFKDCTWYEAATDAYMSVAKHVPGSYARWAVDPDVPALCVMTLCVGVAKHRVPGEQPLGLYWESNAVTSKQYGGHVAFLGPYHGW